MRHQDVNPIMNVTYPDVSLLVRLQSIFSYDSLIQSKIHYQLFSESPLTISRNCSILPLSHL